MVEWHESRRRGQRRGCRTERHRPEGCRGHGWRHPDRGLEPQRRGLGSRNGPKRAVLGVSLLEHLTLSRHLASRLVGRDQRCRGCCRWGRRRSSHGQRLHSQKVVDCRAQLRGRRCPELHHPGEPGGEVGHGRRRCNGSGLGGLGCGVQDCGVEPLLQGAARCVREILVGKCRRSGHESRKSRPRASGRQRHLVGQRHIPAARRRAVSLGLGVDSQQGSTDEHERDRRRDANQCRLAQPSPRSAAASAAGSRHPVDDSASPGSGPGRRHPNGQRLREYPHIHRVSALSTRGRTVLPQVPRRSREPVRSAQRQPIQSPEAAAGTNQPARAEGVRAPPHRPPPSRRTSGP